MTNNVSFAPLDESEKENQAPKSKRDTLWEPIFPVQEGVIEPSGMKHPKHNVAVSQDWPYYDEQGRLLGYNLRFDFEVDGESEKDYRPYTYWKNTQTGECQWKFKGFPKPRPLYGLDWLASNPHATVIICEGEKSALALHKVVGGDYVAVTTGGESSVKYANLMPLKDRKIIIWPDKDKAGSNYAKQLYQRLMGESIAGDVSIIGPPTDKPEKWDAADAIEYGWGKTECLALIGNAQTVKIPYREKIPYRVCEKGLYFSPPAKEDGTPKDEIWLSDPIEVLAQTRDEKGHEWGLLLRWKDADHRTHEEAFSKKHFAASDGKALIEHLLDRGLNISPNRNNRQNFLAYLQTVKPPRMATSVTRVGWKDSFYMLHDGCIPKNEEIYLQNAAIEHGRFKPNGTLPQWREEIGRYIAGNSRLVLFACSAFAAPLLKIADEKEGGGFHLYGGTSVGKSTALEVAASIWGDHDYIHQWRNTDNAFEAVALAHNDGLLCLDELHQVDPKALDKIIYMIANGRPKGRMRKDTTLKQAENWLVLPLSVGEVTVEQRLAEGQIKAHGGMESRFATIAADAGKGYGLYDNIHHFTSGEQLSDHLKQASKRYYGAPIRTFIEKLVPISHEDIKRELLQHRDAWVERYVSLDIKGGQIGRVAKRFGLLSYAGKLANQFEILGCGQDAIDEGLSVCFSAWLSERGTLGDVDIYHAIERIKAWFSKYAHNSFITLGSEELDQVPRTMREQAGFSRYIDNQKQFIVTDSFFKGEFAKGVNEKSLARELVNQGYLLQDGQQNTKVPVRIPAPHSNNKPQRRYIFTQNIIENECCNSVTTVTEEEVI